APPAHRSLRARQNRSAFPTPLSRIRRRPRGRWPRETRRRSRPEDATPWTRAGHGSPRRYWSLRTHLGKLKLAGAERTPPKRQREPQSPDRGYLGRKKAGAKALAAMPVTGP